MKLPRTRYSIAVTGLVVLAGWLFLPLTAQAGNGTFSNGVFNFCVSVRFNATEAQLQQIRTAFQNGSQVLSDATDGQHRFGTVTIVNNSGASESAEYWINSGAGTAYATYGQYGVRGQHVMLYFNSNFQGTSGADGDAYTVAHEHAHHAYGVADEYSGPSWPGCPTVPGRTNCAAECAAPPPPADTASLTFCLMDNYFTRGGRAAGAGYTLNEFCIAANHDLANTNGIGATNTHQNLFYGRSCWQHIAAHPRRSATAPAGLPVNAGPAAHNVTFVAGSGGLRVMVIVDRSGSMSGDRIAFAKSAANVFLNFLKPGDEVGLVSFSSNVRVDVPIGTVTAGGGVVSAIRTAVSGLSASGSTDIGDALIAARNQLDCATNCSCNQIIVLLTDGDHNTGTPPLTVIPSLQAKGITVLSVAVGSGISTSGQAILQSLANQTGGRYYNVASSFGLIGLFLRLSAETTGSGVLASAPFDLPAGGTSNIVFNIESSALSATFALAIGGDPNNIILSLRDPAGGQITETNYPAGVTLITDNNLKAFRVPNPLPGTWVLEILAGAAPSGQLEAVTLVENPGVGLNLFVEDAEVVPAEAMIIHGTPLFNGEAVVGATVSGTVNRPGGSQVPIILFDDGLPEHADFQAGDGVYANRFTDYNQQGTYTFDLEVVNTTGRVFEGESLFASVGHPPNDRSVPPFRRRASATAVLTASPPAGGAQLTPGAIPTTPNRQTGLREQQVTLQNNGAAALAAVRINVSGLPPGVNVYSATGTNAGVPYVLYNETLGAGESVVLTIEYYWTNREAALTTTLTADSAAQEPPPSETGTPFEIRRFEHQGNRTLVEFDTEPGRHYRVEYSVDTVNWKKAIPSLQAAGTRLQWIDAGPPKTDSAPGTNRFYRVLRLD